MNKFAIGCGGLLVIILFIVFVIGLFFWGTYNRLVTLDQNVNKKWGDVQTVYQRRADLIPNLVNTVQGAANFEKSTIVEVTNARASVGRVQLDPSKAPTDAKQLEEFQAAQGQLSNALSRLLVVVERYPELKSNQNFLGLQAQLEGTENRISVERNYFFRPRFGFPALKSNQNFLGLQAQLEGTANRISVERNNFNGTVQ